MVEILKQGQSQPLPVEEQVLSIYAGTEGHLAVIPVENVQAFLVELLEEARGREKAILAEIKDKKALSDDLKKKMNEFVGNFAKAWKA